MINRENVENDLGHLNICTPLYVVSDYLFGSFYKTINCLIVARSGNRFAGVSLCQHGGGLWSGPQAPSADGQRPGETAAQSCEQRQVRQTLRHINFSVVLVQPQMPFLQRLNCTAGLWPREA